MIPKTIYMTYKYKPPLHVFKKWEILNPDYTINFNLDVDCIQFLKQEFSDDIANLFINIKEGMYKADLWRLCILYMYGGVYADIDLVPYVSIDNIIEDNYNFYSCLSADKKSIFQALIITEPRNPLLLQFIMSFIINEPYNYMNGPTYDMYNNIKMLCNNTLGNNTLESETIYCIDIIRIPINKNNIIHTLIELYHDMYIEDNHICIPSNQKIFLFTEKMNNYNWKEAYISYNNMKIFDSRDINYYNAKITNTDWKLTKISIILMIKNGDTYLNKLNYLCMLCEQEYPHYDFEYFMYENNSTDNTKIELENFFINRKGKYFSENIEDNKTFNGDILNERGNYMAMLRKKLKGYHGILDSDYTLLLDCDVIFLPSIINKMIDNIKENIVMVTPYCICWEYYSVNNRIHYYDSLALITKNNIKYSDNMNTCMFKDCTRCIDFRKNKNIIIDSDELYDSNENIYVLSAFGGFVLLKTEVYNNVNWESNNTDVCEHFSFCKNVRKYGDIVICPIIKTITTNSNKRNYDIIFSKLCEM